MPRQSRDILEGLIPGKIRKRGCSSPASSSSSVIQSYRVKRAIMVGKRGGSSTPRPMESPLGSASKRAPPVSARKLAATLWEMNELPSPRVKESSNERRHRRMKEGRAREKIARAGSIPPHLSDPSHSPLSERMDRSETGSRRRRTPSISQRLRLTDNNNGVLDSVSNASLMEIETRSQVQTPSGSTIGGNTRLKDVSNALTTSKELLKIINRMWSHEDRPSSSMPLISALHAELERARLQVNQLIQEQHSDQSEVTYLMKCFAEEKAAWKSKEREVIEAAIESVAGELEVERKLRRRFEGLNKKLGKELADTKASLMKMVKELESEKRAREVVEQVCNNLARDVGEDKAEVEELKKESAKVIEEVEKEREMMQLADMLREERVQMKLSEAKYQLEEKNAAVNKLRSQLEGFLGTRRPKEKGQVSSNQINDAKPAAYSRKTHIGHRKNKEQGDAGEVDDRIESEEDSVESDLGSIELNMDNTSKSYKRAFTSGAARDSRMPSVDEEETAKNLMPARGPRKSTSIHRSLSDGLDWAESFQSSGDIVDWGRLSERDKQAISKSYNDEICGQKLMRYLTDQLSSASRAGSIRSYASPTRQWGQPRSSREPRTNFQEKPPLVPGSGLRSRQADVRGGSQSSRKSKR